MRAGANRFAKGHGVLLRRLDRIDRPGTESLWQLSRDASIAEDLGVAGGANWYEGWLGWPGNGSGREFTFAVLSLESEPVGCCRLFCGEKCGTAYLSYWIGKAYRSRGYASASTAQLLELGRKLGLRRVKVRVRSDNAASRRVLEKNGFRLWTLVPDVGDTAISLFARELEGGPWC